MAKVTVRCVIDITYPRAKDSDEALNTGDPFTDEQALRYAKEDAAYSSNVKFVSAEIVAGKQADKVRATKGATKSTKKRA